MGESQGKTTTSPQFAYDLLKGEPAHQQGEYVHSHISQSLTNIRQTVQQTLQLH